MSTPVAKGAQFEEMAGRFLIHHNMQLIERNFRSYKPNPEEIEMQARKIREMTAHYFLTDEELNQAKNEGRP